MDDSWLIQWAVQKRGDLNIGNSTESRRTEYVASLYWAAATMTSTGYGDIRAGTTMGRLFALCAMLIGLLVSADSTSC